MVTKAVSETRRTVCLPWEGADAQLYPFKMRHWLPHVPTGKFHQVSEEFEIEGTPPNHKVYNRGPTGKLPRDGGPDLLSYNQMKVIFEVSANRGVTLMEAVILVVGERSVSPSWLDSALAAPKVYADPKYRTEMEEQPKATVKKAGKA